MMAKRYESARGDGSKDAPFEFMLAYPWDGVRDLSGWWVSEKLDGQRALWTGKAGGYEFVSRYGNPLVTVPDWFKKGFPDEPLDGEMFLGRGRSHECSGICRRQIKRPGWEIPWRSMRYVAFDAPWMGSEFESRMKWVERAVKKAPYALAMKNSRAESNSMVEAFLRLVEGQGGEGVMARLPGSLYEHRRTYSMLKVKTFIFVTARVVGYTAGEGRRASTIGALTVVGIEGDLAGVKFDAGSGLDDRELANPPRIGDLVKIKYFETTRDGRPRFASYVGVAKHGLRVLKGGKPVGKGRR